MKQILIVVDMQNDFVDGVLGSAEAVAIVPHAVQKILDHEGPVFVTMDTHSLQYADTAEGKKLPIPHCIDGTDGWQLNRDVAGALEGKQATVLRKSSFGCAMLPEAIRKQLGEESFTIEMIGLCTDICVVCNALLLKTFFPEVPIRVDSSCCAGVTPEAHQAALSTMRSCQIDIL